MTYQSVFSGWVFEHAVYRRALERLTEKIDGVLDGGEPFVFPLFGLSGAGKTELLHDVSARYCRKVGPQGHPLVLNVSMPAASTGEALPKRIIATILGNVAHRGNRYEIRERAEKMLVGAGVRVLVLDELNHLVEARKSQSAQTIENRKVADWLKELVERHKISLVLAGLPHSQQILIDNEQMQRRAMRPVEIRPYNWFLKADREEFVGVIQAFVGRLVVEGWVVNADAERVIKACYVCSGGLVGHLRRLFANTEVLRKAKKVLDMDILAAVFDEHFPAYFDGNPFTAERISDAQLRKAYQGALERGSGFTLGVRQ